jgi:hypothetical protein
VGVVEEDLEEADFLGADSEEEAAAAGNKILMIE